MTDVLKSLGKEIEEVLGTITSELKNIAKKHGAWIVIGLVVVYLWRKLK